jgi:hypothetical protein
VAEASVMNEPTIGRVMMEYLEEFFEHKEVVSKIRELQDKKALLENSAEIKRAEIEKSVDPVCGSATKPSIRTYTNGKYQTITVYYDRDIDRGHIVITKNERVT